MSSSLADVYFFFSGKVKTNRQESRHRGQESRTAIVGGRDLVSGNQVKVSCRLIYVRSGLRFSPDGKPKRKTLLGIVHKRTRQEAQNRHIFGSGIILRFYCSRGHIHPHGTLLPLTNRGHLPTEYSIRAYMVKNREPACTKVEHCRKVDARNVVCLL